MCSCSCRSFARTRARVCVCVRVRVHLCSCARRCVHRSFPDSRRQDDGAYSRVERSRGCTKLQRRPTTATERRNASCYVAVMTGASARLDGPSSRVERGAPISQTLSIASREPTRRIGPANFRSDVKFSNPARCVVQFFHIFVTRYSHFCRFCVYLF